MNKIFYIAITALLFMAAGCKKDHEEKNNDSVMGTWELRHIYGGFNPVNDFPAGNGSTLEFKDSTFKRYRNGQLIQSGTYELVKGSFTNGEVTNVPYKIIYKIDIYTSYELLIISEGKLVFYGAPMAVDGTVTHYERL